MQTHITATNARHARTVLTDPRATADLSPTDRAALITDAWHVLRTYAHRARPCIHLPAQSGGDAA